MFSPTVTNSASDFNANKHTVGTNLIFTFYILLLYINKWMNRTEPNQKHIKAVKDDNEKAGIWARIVWHTRNVRFRSFLSSSIGMFLSVNVHSPYKHKCMYLYRVTNELWIVMVVMLWLLCIVYGLCMCKQIV